MRSILFFSMLIPAAAWGQGLAGRPDLRFHQLDNDRDVDVLVSADAGDKSVPLPERVRRVSERFLGTPYRLGPLGEGSKGEFDRDPLISFKEADCTTFVEEVMALAIEGRLGRAKSTLAAIRYKDGNIRYETRNHFPEADWILNNVKAGFLRDITREIGGDRTRTAGKVIKKAEWYVQKTTADLAGFDLEPPAKREKRVQRWREAARGLPDEPVSVDYLPIEELPSWLPKVPSGSVTNLVREDKEGVPVLISHQVLILDGPGGKVVRHAATGGSVEDVPALEFFYKFFNSKWRLLGLNLNEIQDPSAKKP